MPVESITLIGAAASCQHTLRDIDHVGGGNVAHAAMVIHGADRAVARLAGNHRLGLHGGRQPIERRPVIGVWWGRKCPWSAYPARRRYASARNHSRSRRSAAATASMPLRRSVPVRSRTLRSAGGDDLLRRAPFRRGRRPPRHRGLAGPTAGRLRGNKSSASRLADRARRRAPRHGPFAQARWPAANGLTSSGRDPFSCGTGHSGGRGAPSGSASAAFLSMNRGSAFSPQRQPVDQPEAGFADEADPLRNAGQRRCYGRFPGPGQHQRGGVAPGLEQCRPARPACFATASRPRGRSQTIPVRTPGM